MIIYNTYICLLRQRLWGGRRDPPVIWGLKNKFRVFIDTYMYIDMFSYFCIYVYPVIIDEELGEILELSWKF
jgi:hypothetical protein